MERLSNCGLINERKELPPVAVLREKPALLSVQSESSRSIVTLTSRGNARCTSCSRSGTCAHLQTLLHSASANDDAVDQQEEQWVRSAFAQFSDAKDHAGPRIPLSFKAPPVLPFVLIYRPPTCGCSRDVVCACETFCDCGARMEPCLVTEVDYVCVPVSDDSPCRL